MRSIYRLPLPGREIRSINAAVAAVATAATAAAAAAVSIDVKITYRGSDCIRLASPRNTQPFVSRVPPRSSR